MNSAPAAPTPPARQEDENALVISFLAVRQALGYLGYLLPLSLLAYAVTAPGRLEPSISDFYYTPMGDILVGILVAIGIFLVTYTGFERKPGELLSDRWLARIAGADPLPTPAQIRVDVKESDKAYTVHAEVPGVSKDEIHVSIDGNVVTLRAEIKQADTQTSDEKVLRSERYYGAVARSFQLASDIDQAQAKAKYENGVLTLTLPKKAAGGSQRLAIE